MLDALQYHVYGYSIRAPGSELLCCGGETVTCHVENRMWICKPPFHGCNIHTWDVGGLRNSDVNLVV
jgi:hypothetical protein